MGLGALLLVVGSALAPAALVPVDQEIALAELLALVDPSRPELRAVVARRAADPEAAQAALVQHFARRERPVVPASSFPGLGPGNSTTLLGKATPEQAAQWLAHTFTLSNNDLGKPETHQLGPRIAWLENPSQALSWNLYLNQLNHLNSLAGLYRETGDEKLVLEIGESVVTWSQQCPRGFGYTNRGAVTPSGMEVRNRLCNLMATYDAVRAAPALTPAVHLAFWKIFVASARELMTYDGVSFPGLIPLAVMYPEFTESRRWLEAGERNLRSCLVDRTSPDGAWDTQSISYQTVSVPWAARTLEFIEANPTSGDYTAMAAMVKEQTAKLLGLMLQLAMPNGGTPNVGDTYGRADWDDGFGRSVLRQYLHTQTSPEQQAKLNAIPDHFTRLKAALAAACGQDGEPPEASVGFPASGYYVMRSSWEPRQAHYLYLDLTPQGMGHAHNDAGHFDLYAYGKPLLADTGDYFLGWGYRAALHNTIEVDGRDQARGATMLPHEWLATPAFDLADLAHEAYGSLGIRHRRKLLFIKPDYYLLCDLLTGEGSHTYEQFFHFAGATRTSPATAALDPHSLAAVSTNPDVANIRIHPVHTKGLEASFAEAQETAMRPEEKYERAAMLGWMVTGGTFQRVRAPVAVYRRHGPAPQAFQAVLFPTPPGASADVRVEELEVSADGRSLPPTEAIGLVLHATVTRPRLQPDQVSLEPGRNLALGKPGSAEINQTSIAPTTTALTDGNRSTRQIGGGLASDPYTPNVHLKGRFGLDFGEAVEVNRVVLAHGTWNGNALIYPAEKMTVQYWDGTSWRDALEAVTEWRDEQVSETMFRPVRTTRLSVAVERPSGGRLALREFEAYRVTEAELQRVAALRAEKVTERFSDTLLVSHQGSGERRYGAYEFDGELAVIRRDSAGRLTRLSLKDASRLSDGQGLRFAAPGELPYCNLVVEGETGKVDGPSGAAPRLTVGGRTVALSGIAGEPEVAGEPPRILEAKVEPEPAQAGFTGAQPSAVITWRTDRPATGQVRFGEDNRFDRRTLFDGRLATEHRARAWFLKPGQAYTFRIVSQGRGGAVASLELPAR